jgi:hypothetical protein
MKKTGRDDDEKERERDRMKKRGREKMSKGGRERGEQEKSTAGVGWHGTLTEGESSVQLTSSLR